MNKLKVLLSTKLMHFSWDLAFFEYSGNWSLDVIKQPYHVIKNPYQNKWFADPFILAVDDDNLALLVEEFDYGVNRGRIAKVIVDRHTNCITDCKIVLDLSTHLSFPAIYRIKDEILVIPENSESGNSTVYRYNNDSNELLPLNVVSSKPLVDPCYFCDDDNIYVLSTIMPNPNGNVLSLFKSASLLSPIEHIKDYSFDSNIARMGGEILRDLDTPHTFIRPAQDCNGDYGKSVIFQRMKIKGSDIVFEQLGVLKPLQSKYAGIHTFNTFNNIAIIDLKKYDYPFLYKIRCFFKKFFKQ